MYLLNKFFAFSIIILTAVSLTAPAAMAQDAKVIEMEGTDQLKFSKAEITAKPGQEITIKLTTVSSIPAAAMSHNFVLLTAVLDASEVAQTSARYANHEYIATEIEEIGREL